MYASMLIGLAMVVAAPAPKVGAKKGPELAGTWLAESANVGGVNTPQTGTTLTFQAGGVCTIVDGNVMKPIEGTFKLDTKKNPAEIDMTLKIGAIAPGNVDISMLGIFKVEGDTLTICMVNATTGKRPEKFESPAGSQVSLATFKRQKVEK